MLAELKRQRAALDAPSMSRSRQTQAAYEARIDALFGGEKAGRVGVKVLDRSDVLGLLGFGNLPLVLREGKVIKGKTNHPAMTAEHWKKVPQWIESPAAVFDSDTVTGALVFIAPELVNGSMVLVTVEPDSTVSASLVAHEVTNAYDKDGGLPPIRRWIQEGLGHYVDKKVFPDVALRAGLQLSRKAFANKPGMRKILTEKNLTGWRRANNPEGSNPATSSTLGNAKSTLGNAKSTLARAKSTLAGVTQNGSNEYAVWSAISGMFEGMADVQERLERGTVVVEQAEQLPEHLRQAAQDASAQALYDPQTKMVYMVADRIEQGQERAVWLHEVFHKRGEELLGDGLERFHQAAQRWASRPADSIERQIYDAAHARAVADGNYEAEFLAYAIEEAVGRGITPNMKGSMASAGYWLAKVRQVLADAVAKLTGAKAAPDTLTAEDLVAAAYGAAGLEVVANADIRAAEAAAVDATQGHLEKERVERNNSNWYQEFEDEYDNYGTVNEQEISEEGLERDEDGELTGDASDELFNRKRQAIWDAIDSRNATINTLEDIDAHGTEWQAYFAAQSWLKAMGVPYEEVRSGGSLYLTIESPHREAYEDAVFEDADTGLDEGAMNTLKLRFADHAKQSYKHSTTDWNWVEGGVGVTLREMLNAAKVFSEGEVDVGEYRHYSTPDGQRAMKPIRLTLRGWQGSASDLSRLARDVYTKELQGTSVYNDSIGGEVAFTAEGKGEAFGSRGKLRTNVRAELVHALREIVGSAMQVAINSPDKGRERDSTAFRTLLAPLLVDGKMHAVRVTVRDAKLVPSNDTPHKFYDVAAIEIKRSPSVHGFNSGAEYRPASSGASSVTIAELKQALALDTAQAPQSKPLNSQSATTGHAQPLDEPVLTPSGWRSIGELQVGDEVYAHDGTVTYITGVYPQGEQEVFRVELEDGRFTRATADHLWQLAVDEGGAVTIATTSGLAVGDALPVV